MSLYLYIFIYLFIYLSCLAYGFGTFILDPSLPLNSEFAPGASAAAAALGRRTGRQALREGQRGNAGQPGTTETGAGHGRAEVAGGRVLQRIRSAMSA